MRSHEPAREPESHSSNAILHLFIACTIPYCIGQCIDRYRGSIFSDHGPWLIRIRLPVIVTISIPAMHRRGRDLLLLRH